MKFNTQNEKIKAISEKTLVVGIDVGSEFHYARAFDWRGIEFSKKPFKFGNTEPGFTEFKAWILHIPLFSGWQSSSSGHQMVIRGISLTAHQLYLVDPASGYGIASKSVSGYYTYTSPVSGSTFTCYGFGWK